MAKALQGNGRRGGPLPPPDGIRLPARFAEHQRTLMSWPTRREIWGPHLESARREWAEVARAIARFEPVTMLADPADVESAAETCGAAARGRATARAAEPDDTAAGHDDGEISIMAVPLDDSWIRDNGPIFVCDRQGVAAVRFRFDAWGEKFPPWDKDAEVPVRIAEAWGCRLYEAPFVLEGGAFNTDGEGTVLTTEQCLLHHRNLGMARRDYERGFREWLGVEKVIWLPFGLLEDSGPLSTDGHLDDVAQFVAPGVVVAQTCAPGNPNYARFQENLEVLRAATDAQGRRLEVIELSQLPYTAGAGLGDDLRVPGAGTRMPAPYVNMVFVNGAVLLPRLGAEDEDEAYQLIGSCFPDREVVGLPTEWSAFGGGGLGCITQQVPAGRFAT